MQELLAQYPNPTLETAKLIPLPDVMVGDVRPIMLMLLSGATLLLLIACINVVSLLLARSDSRTREIAVRNALGASSARLMLQFATEALIPGIAGGVLGLTLATWGTRLLGSLLSADMMSRMPYLQGIGLNVRLIAATLVLCVMSATAFTLTPVLRVSAVRALRGTEGRRVEGSGQYECGGASGSYTWSPPSSRLRSSSW